MAAYLTSDSTLTDRYQTTVPEFVRRALNLRKRDKIHYTIRPNGEVVLTHSQARSDDPSLLAFLSFIEADMTQHPERLARFDAGFIAHIRDLTGDVAVDLDAPLSKDDV